MPVLEELHQRKPYIYFQYILSYSNFLKELGPYQQYGSKIRPNEMLGPIFDPYCLIPSIRFCWKLVILRGITWIMWLYKCNCPRTFWGHCISRKTRLEARTCVLLYSTEFKLLCISYKFVKGFLAITFYDLLFLAETSMVCVNVVYITGKQTFQLDPTKDKAFAHRPPL